MARLDKDILTRSQEGGNGMFPHFFGPGSVYPAKSVKKHIRFERSFYLMYNEKDL